MSDRIAEIRARLAAATPGPWKIYDGWGPANDGLYRATRIGSSSDTVLAADDDEIKATEGDFELIAMASDDIAYLLTWYAAWYAAGFAAGYAERDAQVAKLGEESQP